MRSENSDVCGSSGAGAEVQMANAEKRLPGAAQNNGRGEMES